MTNTMIACESNDNTRPIKAYNTVFFALPTELLSPSDVTYLSPAYKSMTMLAIPVINVIKRVARTKIPVLPVKGLLAGLSFSLHKVESVGFCDVSSYEVFGLSIVPHASLKGSNAALTLVVPVNIANRQITDNKRVNVFFISF